jgi:beta-phosphoglucomutase-like phosphatase (HAD superfamily)
MTGSSLQQIIARTRHLLLDFDGPVCAVFAGTPAPQVAKQLRDSLAAAGFTLPDDAEGQDDPLEVFRAIAQGSNDAAMLAQHVLTALEVRAVKTAQPTRGSADLITAYRTGRTVTIVSNNSGAAINAYLANHRLADYIKAVVARDDHDPERMKPSPYRVREAVGMLGRPGRRHRQLAIDQPGSPGSASGCWAARLLGAPIVQLAATASRALPAVASHAIGFADTRPTLDPAPTRKGSAPVEGDGRKVRDSSVGSGGLLRSAGLDEGETNDRIHLGTPTIGSDADDLLALAMGFAPDRG